MAAATMIGEHTGTFNGIEPTGKLGWRRGGPC
jgi:hypothetical protein